MSLKIEYVCPDDDAWLHMSVWIVADVPMNQGKSIVQYQLASLLDDGHKVYVLPVPEVTSTFPLITHCCADVGRSYFYKSLWFFFASDDKHANFFPEIEPTKRAHYFGFWTHRRSTLFRIKFTFRGMQWLGVNSKVISTYAWTTLHRRWK